MAIVIQAEQVLSVCPDVSIDDVERDLNLTGDVQQTINRIFDGNFLIGAPSFRDSSSPLGNHDSIIRSPARDLDDNSDTSNELPDIKLHQPIESSNIPLRDFSNKASRSSHNQPADSSLLGACQDSTANERDRHCVDLTLFPGEFIPDVPLKSLSPEASTDCSPISLSSEENSVILPKTRDGSSFFADDDCEPPRSLSRPNAEAQAFHNLDLLSSDDGEVMAKERSSPMSISSSEDEDSGVVLSLLHRIRSRGTHNQPSNHLQDAVLGPEPSTDAPRTSAKRRRLDAHDISDCEEEDGGSSSATANWCPHPEMQCSWETESGSVEFTSEGSLGMSSQASSCNSVVAKKSRRTPEEIAVAKQRAMERRAEKEQQKQWKMKESMNKKQEKMKEALKQKALRDAHKAGKPEECIKYVTTVIDPLLLEESGGATLLTRLQELNCRTTVESRPIPGSVAWRRRITEQNWGQDLELNALHHEKDECEAIVQLPVAGFVDMVHVFKQKQQGTLEPSLNQESLESYAIGVRRLMKEKAVTFVIQGMEQYFRLQKNTKQRQFRSAVRGEDGPTEKIVKRRKRRPIEEITTVITRVDVEEALVDLQLQVGCNVRFVETPEEFAETVAMFTKSVAETPFKRERDKAVFSFHVDTEWAGGVKVTRDGKNLLRVWRQQLQQFRNVSPEIASSIIAVYPSPKLLLKAYAECESADKARKLLKDIVIRRGEGVLATTRRVGPELSKRVYSLLTSDQPQLTL